MRKHIPPLMTIDQKDKQHQMCTEGTFLKFFTLNCWVSTANFSICQSR